MTTFYPVENSPSPTIGGNEAKRSHPNPSPSPEPLAGTPGARKLAAAMGLRDDLKQAGDHRAAQVVGEMANAYRTSRSLNATLHRDIEALQKREAGLREALEEVRGLIKISPDRPTDDFDRGARTARLQAFDIADAALGDQT